MSKGAGPRIAILGCGPRALWALERLAAHAASPGAGLPRGVDVLGPDLLGAGRVYDPDQPDYLRLNVTSAVVDAWCGDAGRGPSLDAWREQYRPGSSADPFPPRALTGRYLHAQAQAVVSELHRRGIPVRQRHRRVCRLHQRPDGWHLDGQGPYDRVLLTPGHAWDWPGALRHSWAAGLPPLHPAVFPVQDLLARPELRPGATVLVRGAALTAIDALLALTLGRGQAPGEAELRIVLSSRTGALMLPKTDPAVLAAVLERAGDLTPYRERAADLPEVLTDLATRLLGDDATARAQVSAAVDRLLGHVAPTGPLAQLRTGVAIATGAEPPDGAWALGQAWRTLYPDLVARQEAGGGAGPVLGWAGYPRWSRVMERLAFGPPLVNARLLLEAMEAGVVTVRTGDTAELARQLRPDLVVDAVLPPPGILDLPAEDPLGRLREERVLCAAPGGRGARVDRAGAVLSPDGSPVAGLALVGRATEDAVLGNDTLIRSLHPAVDRWARDILDLPTHVEEPR